MKGYCTELEEKLIRRGERLGKSPQGHGDDQFLRQIFVSFDVVAPRYWGAQFDTYHHTVKNSMSTMHTLGKLKTVTNGYVEPEVMRILQVLVDEYNADPCERNMLRVKSNLPEGVMLAAGVSTNYAQLKTMYYQRRTHRLPEWREFCDWIANLPYAKQFGVCGC